MDPSNLLKMLEPAIRPGGSAGTAPGRAGSAPFETQPFEQLLQQARLEGPPATPADDTEEAVKTNPLHTLSDFGRIENTSLRKQLEAARTPATES